MTLGRILAIALWMLIALGWVISPRSGAPQNAALNITTAHELYGMSTDLDAPVGDSIDQLAFEMECDGAQSTAVTISHDNPNFVISLGGGTIQCGSIYDVRFSFSPTRAGLTTDNVTF